MGEWCETEIKHHWQRLIVVEARSRDMGVHYTILFTLYIYLNISMVSIFKNYKNHQSIDLIMSLLKKILLENSQKRGNKLSA